MSDYDSDSDKDSFDYTVSDEYEKVDFIYDLIYKLQSHCVEKSLPIFNKRNTTQIIFDLLL
jgi:hypothetical protein